MNYSDCTNEQLRFAMRDCAEAEAALSTVDTYSARVKRAGYLATIAEIAAELATRCEREDIRARMRDAAHTTFRAVQS